MNFTIFHFFFFWFPFSYCS